MGGCEMTIKYTNTREDYEKSFDFILNYLRLIQCIAMGVISAILTLYISIGRSFTFFIIITIIVILMNCIGYMYFYKKRLPKKIKEGVNKRIETQPTLLKEKTVEMTEDKFIITNSQERTEHIISSIDRIVEKNNFIFIFIQKWAPLLIIPQSAFDDTSSKDEFIKIIKSKSEAKYIKKN